MEPEWPWLTPRTFPMHPLPTPVVTPPVIPHDLRLSVVDLVFHGSSSMSPSQAGAIMVDVMEKLENTSIHVCLGELGGGTEMGVLGVMERDMGQVQGL